MKQYIIFRKDIIADDMPLGKIMGQACHASVSAFELSDNDSILRWKETGETKIILCVKSEIQLENLYQKILSLNLPVSKIIDEGRTVFKNPTFTCLGIGPIENEDLEKITKKLRLLCWIHKIIPV